ncbi:Hypothetical_protein [Hexamita inflata]|uniref:Hypothetical_protein n=1 Tax=Hexamita inflata TaxID=28002 RepID=A0AA86NQH8_9EUKA|nr:Hypothetical protein HINF_LOCUS11608 [Hexamita inflata]
MELTCLFTGLYHQDSFGSHLFPRTRTHGHQSGSRDFALNFMHFMQCALSSSLISLMAETIASTALVCPKHAVLSLSVLTSISGAAGSFCWHLSSSFVRSGMRETLVICNKCTFIQLSQNETRTTLLGKQVRTMYFRVRWLWLWQVEPVSIRETGSKWTSRNWNNVSLFSSASTAGFLDRKLNSSKSIRASWLTGIDYDK